MSGLGDFFRARRIETGLTTGQLARLAGFTNLGRGSNRIRTLEAGGKVSTDLLAKLASALEVSPDEVRRLEAEEYRGWLARVDEPVRPHLVIRHMACVYERAELPDDAVAPGAAEAYAARLARQRSRVVCLVLSRRLAVGFDAAGREFRRLEAAPNVHTEPYAAIGGRRIQFDFGAGKVPHPNDEAGP